MWLWWAVKIAFGDKGAEEFNRALLEDEPMKELAPANDDEPEGPVVEAIAEMVDESKEVEIPTNLALPTSRAIATLTPSFPRFQFPVPDDSFSPHLPVSTT